MKNKVFLFASISFAFFPTLAWAGAGGTSGDDGGLGIILLIILLPALIGFAVYKYLLFRRSKKDAWKVVRDAAQLDPAWNVRDLKTRVKSTFRKVQKHWSRNEVEECRKYLHPSYKQDFTWLLQDHINKGEFNKISGIAITGVDIVMAKNFIDDDRDLFVAYIQGTMNDVITDREGNIIEKRGDGKDSAERSIDEFWYFQRQGDEWLVKEITKEKDPLYDISVDEENWPQNRRDLKRRSRSFSRHIEDLRESKRRYVMIASAVGVSLALLGYAFYGWIAYLIFKLF